MSSYLKNQKGFTLIEILVVVIIVAILAAFAVPRYMRYVEKSRSTEAQTALRAIRNAYDIRLQNYGTTDDYTIEDAMLEARLGKGTETNWDFEVVGNPPKKYIATSTADFAAGEGKQVWYDEDEAAYHGYGVDEWTDIDTGGKE
ncbi:MAG: prepilin-type N-terminal cleavage/methylation domain-containing protein [Candidatus Cloacimonetes bacterium]|nr:prepilin-type N-terminal cleavage/methylation domain-containing protein [Candidatus Cloacimonadota bacterium]